MTASPWLSPRRKTKPSKCYPTGGGGRGKGFLEILAHSLGKIPIKMASL